MIDPLDAGLTRRALIIANLDVVMPVGLPVVIPTITIAPVRKYSRPALMRRGYEFEVTLGRVRS